MIVQHNITPVILAGGQGLRLRPFTSSTRPKPFLRMGGRHSFFQKTVLRAKKFNSPVIVCHADYVALVEEHLAEIGVNPAVIIAEPDHRGTAAAISLAAFYLRGKDTQMLVMPSDHVINDNESFESSVLEASAYADQSLVMLGAPPRKASARFGYICAKAVEGRESGNVFEVDGFMEKPDLETAKVLLRDDVCFWNTGIFICHVRELLEQLSVFVAPIFQGAEAAHGAGAGRDLLFTPDRDAFLALPPMSIDYALMEKLSSALVIPLDCGWDDIGVLFALLRRVVFFR